MTREKLIKRFPFFATQDLDHAFDQLTEVFTRDVIRNYIKYLMDNKTPFSLFMADVDNFKYINDGFGHREGDSVLTSIAKFLMDSLDTKGVVGRFGGDEFLLVCEGIVDYNEVWKIGHEINMTIGNLRFSNKDMPSITLSMGVARFPLDTVDYDELWELADKALYRGKMKGRNCFIIYLESKHKNLDLKGKRDLAFSPMYLHAKIFNTLTETPNLSQAIKNLLLFLVSYRMFDHLCIETPTGMKFKMIHTLSKHKDFKSVNYDHLKNIVDNTGLSYANKISSYSSSMNEAMLRELEDQNVVSCVYCRIDAFDKIYGYIRIDMTDTVRIWQNDELSLVMDTAKAIGLMLYYNKTDIESLDPGDTEIVGKE